VESVRAKSDLHGFGDSRTTRTEVGSGARQVENTVSRYSEESTSGLKMTRHGNRHLSSTESQEVHFMSRSDVAGPNRSASSRSSVGRLLDLSGTLSTTRRALITKPGCFFRPKPGADPLGSGVEQCRRRPKSQAAGLHRGSPPRRDRARAARRLSGQRQSG
jgi:hypothetical protein